MPYVMTVLVGHIRAERLPKGFSPARHSGEA
jgi:hypothetical protein